MPKAGVVTLEDGRLATRQERVQRKEDIIITAARNMFMESGFKGATMAQIARASGVADGTLYTYFQNKEALARAVVTDFYGRLTRTAQEGVDALTGTEARLKFLARHHLMNMIEEQGVLAILSPHDMDFSAYEGSELFDLNKNYAAIFDRVVRDGQAHGEISPDLTLWILRDIFFGSLDYGSRTMLIKGRQSQIDDFVKHVIGLVLAPKAVSTPDEMHTITQRLERAATRMEALLKDDIK